ncbi:MAG: peptidoglycan D,D-transpeptidase FtsI family protein [Hyphomicrobiaceae bacterium]
MRRGVTITTEAIALGGRMVPAGDRSRSSEIYRALVATIAVVLAFSAVGAQLVRLALTAAPQTVSNTSSPLATSVARPDLVDRNGRLLASDVEVMSLYADPSLVLDRDEVSEKLARIFPDLDTARVRELLADRTRRFVWLRRGLAPETAQRVHNLGLPGLSFRTELRRAYPGGELAGHLLGGVNVENRAIAGVERHLDDKGLIETVVSAAPSAARPVALSIDLGVQHTLEEELASAMATFEAAGAAGLVLDVTTGEVLASASRPGVDPARPEALLDQSRIDRIAGGTYELGSIFKLLTVAEAIEAGRVDDRSIVDVTRPLKSGRFDIKDLHPPGRSLTVTEVFTKSSNVGSAMLALGAGSDRQRAFLSSLGLLTVGRTEAGPIAAPQVPSRWAEIETITVSYGHGLAVAPLQFAAAAAALVNGGDLIQPTLLKRQPGDTPERRRVISAATSSALARMMRANVAEAGGTGRRADVPGYRVGGKTGTAEIAVKGRYMGNSVISSFLGAFPMDRPRFLTLVLIFEPSRTRASDGEITAGHTAAPVTARLIGRIAPQLGVLPAEAGAPGD